MCDKSISFLLGFFKYSANIFAYTRQKLPERKINQLEYSVKICKCQEF